MRLECSARLFVIGLALGLPLAALIARLTGPRAIEIHGKMAEIGGWTPGDIAASVGEPIRLRLTSGDVMHGFAVGQTDWPALDVKPGEVTETTLAFDRPGKYTFYCTRWCGPNHWRMRGTIEVTGGTPQPVSESVPLYVTFGLDIDRSPHPAEVFPAHRPSAARGAQLGAVISPEYLTQDYYRSHGPVAVWRVLIGPNPPAPFPFREGGDSPLPLGEGPRVRELWDLVALIFQSNTTPQALEEGRALYAANCAACHGEDGAGDGVMAAYLGEDQMSELGHGTQKPANFADASRMFGASPALLQGKIVRGGMGTGMPYWGPIFTEEQTWSLVAYLWTFTMEIKP